jgi:hypothetical protein
MIKRGLSLVLVLGVASLARADVVVNLAPAPSANAANPAGVYDPGESIRVDVGLSQTDGPMTTPAALRLLRIVQLDFSMSSPQLDLSNNPDLDTVGDGTGFDGVQPDFQFDVASFPFGGAYFGIFPALPIPAMAYTGTTPNAARQLNLLATGANLNLGFINVGLPAAPGDYTLDAVTPSDPEDDNLGGLVSFGFGVLGTDPIVDWRPGSGLTQLVVGADGPGGAKFSVVPEPVTIAFLALGGIAVALRRRRSA